MQAQAGESKHDRCTQCLVASRGGKTRAIRIALTAKHGGCDTQTRSEDRRTAKSYAESKYEMQRAQISYKSASTQKL